MRLLSLKARWSRPELVVLARGRPEESVLDGCKVDGSLTGPYATYHDCRAQGTNKCSGPCSSRNKS